VIDDLLKALDTDADFVEARASRSWSTRIGVRDKEIESLVVGAREGAGVRVMHKGAWGFAASNTISDTSSLVKSALKLAKASSRRPIQAELADVKPSVAKARIRPKKHPSDTHADDKARQCLALSKRALADRKVHATDIGYGDVWGEWCYVNSEGARIEYHPVRSVFTASAFVKGEGLMRASDRAAGLRGVELLDAKEGLVDKVVSKARLLLKSELPPRGEFPVVIDPRMAGVLAHEAVGHACEADAVLNKRTILGNRQNTRIGSSHVTIIDDPTLPKYYGSYPFDDEGTPAQKKVLVRNGVLKSFLHSRETAAKLRQKPTGNARAESALAFPLVRMSNTFFERGTHSLRELLEPVKNGVFVEGMKGGVTEPSTGFFQFAAECGSIIENGELTKPLRDITLVGNILTTLKAVEACGRKWHAGTPGSCGKAGQAVPVSDGGPHIRIKKILVGG
jgi:TldD protein